MSSNGSKVWAFVSFVVCMLGHNSCCMTYVMPRQSCCLKGWAWDGSDSPSWYPYGLLTLRCLMNNVSNYWSNDNCFWCPCTACLYFVLPAEGKEDEDMHIVALIIGARRYFRFGRKANGAFCLFSLPFVAVKFYVIVTLTLFVWKILSVWDYCSLLPMFHVLKFVCFHH